jgi:NADPH:quinone reductase
MLDANLNAYQQSGPPFMMAAIARSSSEPIQVCSSARPIAQPGQVLVRTQASGVNPLDTKIYAQAAALPLVFITAWEGLVDRAAVRAGQTVLIHGGAGGIGHIAVQLANSVGATVFATGSTGQRGQIEGLRATFIDYTSERVNDYIARLTGGAGFDVIFDTVGGATLDASFEAVRRFGHVVSALGWGTHALGPLSFRAATYSGIFTLLPLLTHEGREHHGEILEAAARLVEAGNIRPHLDPRRFTLESVGEAYVALKNRTTRGKLVVDAGDAA